MKFRQQGEKVIFLPCCRAIKSININHPTTGNIKCDKLPQNQIQIMMSQVQGRGTRGKRGAPEDRMVGLTFKGLVLKFHKKILIGL